MRVNPLIVFHREFDGSGILFNPDNGETFGLNPTAAFLWERLSRGLPREQILAELAEASNAPPSAAADFDEFTALLTGKGYLAGE